MNKNNAVHWVSLEGRGEQTETHNTGQIMWCWSQTFLFERLVRWPWELNALQLAVVCELFWWDNKRLCSNTCSECQRRCRMLQNTVGCISESVIACLRPTHLSVVAVNLMVQRYLEAEESVCAIDQQKPGLMSFLLLISKMRSQCLQWLHRLLSAILKIHMCGVTSLHC